MPHSVPPPEAPTLIDSLPSEQVIPSDDSSVVNQSLSTAALAKPTPPEAFAREFSPLTAAKSAALLGPSISVGHSILPAGAFLEAESPRPDSSDAQAVATVTNTQSEPKSAPVGNQISSTPAPKTPQKATLIASLAVSGLGTSNPEGTRILTQERGGGVREFQIQPPLPQTQPFPGQPVTPTPSNPQPQNIPAPSPETPSNGTPTPTVPLGNRGAIELTADRQEYDVERQVITAEGNVVLRFQQAVLDADRVQINLPNRIAVATGNVALRRGQQVLRGDRFEYYFVQDSGAVLNASGEVYQPTATTDLSVPLPNDVGATILPTRPLSDRIAANQPLQQISNPGGFTIGIGAGRNIENLPPQQVGGTINRVRFQAERVDFNAEGFTARKVRLTNDPFSPPELELRADTAQFRRINPLVSEITASRPRLVFDQGLEVPLFRDRVVIDRRPREPGLINFGYDATDRGGLFVERSFEPINTPGLRVRITPQYFIQKAVSEGNILGPGVFGARAKLDATLNPRTAVQGSVVLTSLNPNDFENRARASLRLQRTIGTTLPHTLNLEYSYRDRLFNGSLGFQTVQRSIGAVLASPVIPLGKSGINLTYQAGAQYINADTDRPDLLKADRTNNRIDLGRYQASASLSRGFLLWQGKGLPPTPTEGLRYTPIPVVPYLQLNTGVTGVATAYSSGDTQNSLSGSIGIQGQIGHFSRRFLDYTGFNLTYFRTFPNGQSPFLFDRVVDTKVLSGGINQQIYGPLRLGFQTAVNLDNGQRISTDYYVEYSRRAYNIILRYNPVLQIGSINFRINDFNWLGNPEPFSGSEVRPVIQGVPR